MAWVIAGEELRVKISLGCNRAVEWGDGDRYHMLVEWLNIAVVVVMGC